MAGPNSAKSLTTKEGFVAKPEQETPNFTGNGEQGGSGTNLNPKSLVIQPSKKQRLPNLNATGPRTKFGKRRASRNSTKHGLLSKVVLIPGEAKDEYENLLAKLWEDRQPVGALEELLVEKLATTAWRQRRLLIAEGAEIRKNKEFAEWDRKLEDTNTLEALLCPENFQKERPSVETARTQVKILCHNVPDAPGLDRLLRYETSLERSFDRTLSQLERLQRIRRGQPVSPELNVRVTQDN